MRTAYECSCWLIRPNLGRTSSPLHKLFLGFKIQSHWATDMRGTTASTLRLRYAATRLNVSDERRNSDGYP